MSHFNDNNKAFWLGVNGMEYISWENSNDIIEYNPYYYPLPTHVIHTDSKIKNEDDMYNALENGKWYVLSGEEID